MSPAELISKLYRLRWMIELFFRTIKSMLHCNHLLMTFNKETETMYRGLTPRKITPMSGVLHAKSGLRVVLKWMIAGSGSVIVDVIHLDLFRFISFGWEPWTP